MMAKIEISNKLWKRAKQRKKFFKEKGINKSLLDCVTELKMESDKDYFNQFMVSPKKNKKDFFGGGVL